MPRPMPFRLKVLGAIIGIMVSKAGKSRIKYIFFPEISIIVIAAAISVSVAASIPDPGNSIVFAVAVTACSTVTMLLMARLVVVKLFPLSRQRAISSMNYARDELHRWTDDACFEEEWGKVKKRMATNAKRGSIVMKVYTIFTVIIACCSAATSIGHLVSMQDPVLRAVKIAAFFVSTVVGVVFSYVIIKYCLVATIQSAIAQSAADDVKKRTSRE
jgi:hypothetical protein